MTDPHNNHETSPKAPASAPRYYSVARLAKLLAVSHSKVTAWIRAGELRAMNAARDERSRPHYRISPAAVEEFEKCRAVHVTPARRARRRAPATKDYFADL